MSAVTDKPSGNMPLAQALRLAARYRASGRLADADALLRPILNASPRHPQALHRMGLVLFAQGQVAGAIELLSQAVAEAPSEALYHCNLGEMHRLAGQADAALACAEAALAVRPDYPEACNHLGIAHFDRGELDRAIECYRRAITLRPDFPEAHNNLGNALRITGPLDEAEAAFAESIRLRPEYADAYANLGSTLQAMGRYADAMASFERALAIAPRHGVAHAGRSLVLLVHGRFDEGWPEYEWRWAATGRPQQVPAGPPWRGDDPEGQRVLVWAEQGLGDLLQFCRYLPLLRARGAHPTLLCPPPVVPLITESMPWLGTFSQNQGLPPYDLHVPLLSLPRLMGTRLETIPAQVPYLVAEPAAAERWRAVVGEPAGLKVGLVWRGNPGHINDRRRSIPPAQLAPLLAVAGVRWFSLQVGPDAEALSAQFDGRVATLGERLTDFAETAAAIANLDLIISVDTAVAHLAGAMAKPVWVLIPSSPDWRWLLERADSPWYPTMRLFRQDAAGGWTQVAERVAAELARLVGGEDCRLLPALSGSGQPAPSPSDDADPDWLHPDQALALAERHRRAGRIAQAETLCRQVLEVQPQHAESLHQLAILRHRQGAPAEAVRLLRAAIAADGGKALYHANLAEMLRQTGQLDAALESGLAAVALGPTLALAHNNLGAVHFDRGEIHAALDRSRRAVEFDPGFAQAHSNLGNALRASDQSAAAMDAYEQAVRLAPDLADAHNNLGTLLREAFRPQESAASYRRALAIKPDDPATLNNLALVLGDLKQHREALDLLHRSVALAAGNPMTFVYLASTLLELDRPDDADQAIRRALALAPNNPEAVQVAGRVRFAQDDTEAALDLYRRAIELKPDLADAYNNMANALKQLGRLAEARAASERALELGQTLTAAYLTLADSKRFAADDPQIARMEQSLTQPLSEDDRLHLHFALGKAYEDIGRFELAFSHLHQGNAIKRARIAYDEPATLALFERMRAAFDAESMRTRAGQGDPSTLPIFVLGMPRSGTTLVEQVLASHPLVHGAGELRDLREVLVSARTPDGRMLPDPEGLTALTVEDLRALGAAYVTRLAARAPNAARVTDKMPSNFFLVGPIHLVLPRARIVHIRRNPADTCLSCYQRLFAAGQPHTYDLAELGRYYRAYDALMAHWRAVLPPGAWIELEYEAVVADLEGEARRLLEYCGLPWDSACLAFHRTRRPVKTASAAQVRQPLYGSSVRRWRAYGDALNPLLDALGEGLAGRC